MKPRATIHSPKLSFTLAWRQRLESVRTHEGPGEEAKRRQYVNTTPKCFSERFMERFWRSETPSALDAPVPSHNNHETPYHDSPIRLALEQGIEHPVVVPV